MIEKKDDLTGSSFFSARYQCLFRPGHAQGNLNVSLSHILFGLRMGCGNYYENHAGNKRLNWPVPSSNTQTMKTR